MRTLKLGKDEQGSAIIEFAVAVPILITMIYAIFQFGLVLFASAGIQHALGEGARRASLYPAPSDATIQTVMTDSVFGIYLGSVGTPQVQTPAATVCTNCRLLSITYTVTPNYIWATGTPVSMTRTKQVYLAVPAA